MQERHTHGGFFLFGLLVVFVWAGELFLIWSEGNGLLGTQRFDGDGSHVDVRIFFIMPHVMRGHWEFILSDSYRYSKNRTPQLNPIPAGRMY